MAEYSGFYEGRWDDELLNPITKEYTGWWDRSYLTNEFMDYFALFVSNGVFISPTDQLKVFPFSSNQVAVKAGWAFINGSWYHNDSNFIITVPPNLDNSPRTDSVRIRYDDTNRITKIVYFSGDTELVRSKIIYDLEIAKIIIPSNFESVTLSMISDSRPNEDLCGFVTGLLNVIGTKDLFSQLQGIFDDWFETVSGQVEGDLAIKLQMEFDEINQNFIDYKNETQQMITDYETEIKQISDDTKTVIETFVEKNFIIQNQVLTFVDKRCKIENEHVTENSLVDVYFNSDTIKEAEECHIWVESSNDFITLYAEKQPSYNLVADIRIWRI